MSDLLLSASFENSLIHAYENIGLIFPEYQIKPFSKDIFLATEYLVGIELKVNSNVKVNCCKILSFKGKPSSDQNFMYCIPFSFLVSLCITQRKQTTGK